MNIILSLLLFSCFGNVSWTWASAISQRTEESTTILPVEKDCLLDGVNILELPYEDPFIFNRTIYDNIPSSVNYSVKIGANVSNIYIELNKYVALSLTSPVGYKVFIISPVDETTEISLSTSQFYYSFPLLVYCGSEFRRLDCLIPIHETNTYNPTFLKEIYEYSLISQFSEDLDRLMELNPIIANDNDMSNTEVIFFIEPNDYFDLQYAGVVPGTLNKNHKARLVAKNTTIGLTETLKLMIRVTDIGLPRKFNYSTLIVKPPNMDTPTFKKVQYIGDYYGNGTFIMRTQPELEFFSRNYKVLSEIKGDLYNHKIWADIRDTEVTIGMGTLEEIVIYKYEYLVYTLNVTFIDPQFTTHGYATIIVELHKP